MPKRTNANISNHQKEAQLNNPCKINNNPTQINEKSNQNQILRSQVQQISPWLHAIQLALFYLFSGYNQACKQIQLNHVAEDTLKNKELAAQSMIKH